MRIRVLHRSFVRAHLVTILMGAFALIGTAMLVGGGVLVHDNMKVLATASRAEGSVVALEHRRGGEGGGTYVPVVMFRTEHGEEITFRGTVATNPPAFRTGETVRVLYDPDMTVPPRIDSFWQLWFGTVILGILGSVFGGIGWGYWGSKIAGRRLEAWLDRHGRRIEAEVVDVGLDRAFSFNHQSPWRIRAQWHDETGGELYLFNSRALWFDPEPFLHGGRITVLIDPDDPRRYKMDLAGLS